MSGEVDDALILLNMAQDNYIGLDAVGRRIWELLATPQRAGDLCDQLCREFDGPPEQITTDVLAFLDELAAENMVKTVDEQST